MEVFIQSRLVHVWAVFTKESESPIRQRLILGGEVYSFEKTGEGRNNLAVILFSEEYSDPLGVGDYRLSSMNCLTSSGASLDISDQTLPKHIIRLEHEPDDEIPRLGESRLRVR